MKKLIDAFFAALLCWVGLVGAWLSIPARTRLGKLIGLILRLASTSRRKVTMTNISNAWPEMPRQWHQSVVNASYGNLGIVLVEILSFRYLTNTDILEMIQFTNIDVLQNAHRNGKGMMLLSGHFGNWELLAFAAGLCADIPLHIVVAPQHNPYANEYINAFRTRHNNHIVPMTNAARAIIHLLQKHQAVAMLADQASDSSTGIFVDFFQMPAATYETPAALALKYQIPLIIGFAVRQRSGVYSVTLEPIPYDDLTYSQEGIAKLTQRHVNILEQAIRRHPEQWSWQHKRWKS